MDTEKLCNEIRKQMEGVNDQVIPLEGFPQKFQKLVLDLSLYEGYNVEISVMCLLSALSAAIGNALWIHVKGNWLTNAALFIMIVGRPGLGKTHPMRFAYGPVYDWDKVNLKRYKEELDDYNRQSSKEKVENVAEKPKLVKTVMSDFTVEAMMKLLNNNPRGVALVIDEFPSLFKRIARSHDDTYEKLLSSWSNERLISDRKCEDMPICIDKPCVNLIGGIQTDIVAECVTSELLNNGFSDRVLYVCPRNKKQKLWDSASDDAYYGDDVRQERKTWSDMLTPLFELTDVNDADAFPIRVLNFDREAKKYFYDWVNSIINKNNAIENDELIESRDQKLNSQAARLALLIQALRWTCGESHLDFVDLVSVKAAINLLLHLEQGCAEVLDNIKSGLNKSSRRESKYAFIERLPPRFTFEEALAASGKSKRTVHNYLDDLCVMSQLVHSSHNLYEKVQDEE